MFRLRNWPTIGYRLIQTRCWVKVWWNFTISIFESLVAQIILQRKRWTLIVPIAPAEYSMLGPNFPISFRILKYRNRRNATIYHSFLLLWLSELCWILSQDNLYQYKKTSFSYHLKTFQTQKLFNHWHHCRRFHHWHHWHRFHQCHHRHQGHRCHCCLERNQIATKKKGDFYQILVRKLNFQLQKIWNVNLGNNIDICVPGAKSLFQLTWFWFSKSHWVLSTVQTNSKMEDICFHPPSNIWKLSHTLQ